MSSALPSYPGVALVTGAGAGQPMQLTLPDEKCCMLTHQNTGIGRGIACAFAREHCQRIVLADLAEGPLQETKTLIEGISPEAEVLVCIADVSSPTAVTALLDKTTSVFGRVDYAVNAAGILGVSKRSHEMSVEEFDRVVNVDYRGCWLCSREEIKHMIKQDPLPSHDGRLGNRG